MQSPADSLAWQRARAESVIVNEGQIVEVYHDIDASRSLPWKRRPEASRLLAEVAKKDRGFDAVVIGEPQRAFSGGQYTLVAPVLRHYGVRLFIPEFGGEVDWESDAHEILAALYGTISASERRRIQIRVRTAMLAQAGEGRWMGGTAPYGYLLIDTDTPHPNPHKARDGKKLKVLVPDPIAAPVVRRIFESYLGGKGLMRICDDLNAEGIENPSSRQPDRYPHRQANCGSWSKSALAHILRNPSYCGQLVYSRSRRQEVLIDPTDPGQGTDVRRRALPVDQWVFAAQTHEPIITPETFQATQERMASRRFGKGPQELAKGRRPYALRGLITCEACGNRLSAVTIKGVRYYRCYLTTSFYSRKGPAGAALSETHPRASYLREDRLLPRINELLMGLFDPANIEETAKLLAEDAAAEVSESAYDAQTDRWSRALSEAEANLRKYRAVVEAGDAPVEVVGRWIAEAEEQRRKAAEELARLEPQRPPTVDEVKALLTQFRRVANRLKKADPQILHDAYRALGLRIVYQPKAAKARWELAPGVSSPSDPVSR